MRASRLASRTRISVLLLAAFGGLAPAGVDAQVAPEARIHPRIPLLDAQGMNVLRSGRPVSPRATCGECHDVEFISTHTLHTGPGMERMGTPAEVASSRPRDRAAPIPTNGDADPAGAADAEMNCFLCHTPRPSNDERLEALREGDGAWAPVATLANTAIVVKVDGGWRYDPSAFDAEGRVLDSLLALQGPVTGNCAQCHGLAGDALDDPVSFRGLDAGAWQTVSRGEVISPQRISESGVNLVGKSALSRPWDVHAERLLECAQCHFSENNPIYRKESPETQPEGLIFDSRRMPLGAYLQRPSHHFAGQSVVAGGTRVSEALRCQSCHDPEPTHRWLPYAKRHIDALACEVCHTPMLHSVAVESVDWSRLDGDGNPQVTWRGCASGCETAATDLVRGVEPTLLLREEEDGHARLAPYNLVTSWYWVAGTDGEPVPLERVGEASTGAQSVEEVRSRLSGMGVEDPHLKSEIQPYPIHHSAVGGEWATRECSVCHDESSRLSRAVVLAPSAPGGGIPVLVEGAEASLVGGIEVNEEGALVYCPAPRAAGLFVLGHDFVWWSNLLGILAVVGTLVGVLIHGGLRWRAARRLPPGSHLEGPPVYMYSTYERAWHWLQALAIFLLLATGIEIHVTRLGLLDFAVAVRIHNVVGFIVLANALFAAFYHLASGEIRHYLPRPEGFFNAAITQAGYYLRGIFRGESHPFEKTPGRKLNPLQQITYLGILNVLLPLQVVTGVLIWGAQRWPVVDGWMGGLAFLAPLHAFGAWMFAAFLLMHVYLTTTGSTPLSNIQAMVVGWEGGEAVPERAEAL